MTDRPLKLCHRVATEARRFVRALHPAIFEKPVEFTTLIAAIISVIIIEYQLIEVQKTLESQAYSYIDNNLITLDKTFIENPEYRKYFDKRGIGDHSEFREAKDPAKLAALVDLKLDIIDSFYSQAGHIKWSPEYTREAWDRYFEHSFARSTVLCWQICRDWIEYGKQVRMVALKENACGPKQIMLENTEDIDSKCTWGGPK